MPGVSLWPGSDLKAGNPTVAVHVIVCWLWCREMSDSRDGNELDIFLSCYLQRVTPDCIYVNEVHTHTLIRTSIVSLAKLPFALLLFSGNSLPASLRRLMISLWYWGHKQPTLPQSIAVLCIQKHTFSPVWRGSGESIITDYYPPHLCFVALMHWQSQNGSLIT